MTEFGKTLREAREAKGITTAQIAAQTHLLPQIVEDLENEDFHRISAPIYGRGFVKLYCEAVGIEPKPLVDEFMAILNGERTPSIRLKEVELPPDEPAEPAEPAPPPPPVYTQPELGEETPPPPVEDVRQETRDTRPVEDARLEARDESEDLRRERAAEPPPPPRQYRPDYAKFSSLGSSVNFGRLAILAGGAIAIILALFFGVRAVYRASMGISGNDAAPAHVEDAAPTPQQDEAKPKKAEAKAAEKKTAEKKTSEKKASDKKTTDKKSTEKAPQTKTPAKTARTPKPVPPLYID